MYKIFHKFAMILANFSILVNTFLTPITVYAQDLTPTETPSEVTETTPAPTDVPQETVAPTAEPTQEPTPVVTVAPTVEVTPTPEISPEPTTNNPQPTTTPEGQVEGTSTETPEGTTTIEVTTNEENAHVAAVVIENVEASSVTEEDIVYDGTGTPQLVTDKADYAPTDVVLISGTGFEPNKEYDLVITGTGEFRFDDKVKSDESGGLFYTYQLDGTYRPDYQVEVLDGGSSVSSVTFTDGPTQIEYSNFEGEIALQGSNNWTNGNISGYKENDTIRFRLDLTASAAGSGNLFIGFTSDPTCQFFKFQAPTSISGTGVFSSVSYVPPLVQNGSDAVANFAITSTGAGTGKLNFTLQLSDGAAGCASGSSQHVQVDHTSDGVKWNGNKALPIPANAVAPVTDITISKTAPLTKSIGQSIAYSLTVTNLDSSTTATSVVVTDTLPTGVSFVSGSWTKTSPSATGSCTALAQIVTCNIGNLSGGATSTITINGTVNNNTQLCSTTQTNTTSVSTTTLESNSANNSSQASTDINPCLGTLTVNKNVVPSNDTGKFNLQIDGSTAGTGADVGNGGSTGVVTVASASHTVSETAGTDTSLADYTSVIGGDCAVDGTVTVSAGQNKVCSITNTRNTGTLQVLKNVDLNGDGDYTDANETGATDWKWQANAGSDHNTGDTAITVNTGDYALTETAKTDFHQVSLSCTGGILTSNSVAVTTGASVVCTFVNARDTGTITFTKVVTNNYGGSLGVADFPLFIDGDSVTSGTPNTLLANRVYTLTETQQTGYTGGYFTGDCNPAGSITLLPGDNKSCTITNTDVQPKLTVTKVVINDNGGTKEVTDFPLFVDSTTVKSGAQHGYNAGTYTVSETSDPGYTSSITGDCSSNGSITLSVGDVKSCTITNDDDSPSLTLVKEVTTDNGGQEVAGAWTLTASGPSGFSGSGPSVSNGASFDSGTYDLSESGPSGYTASDWVCVGGSQTDGDTVVVGLGDDVTCTITNDDTAPKLTLIKDPTNDDGGNALPDDFQLTIGGNPATSGTSYTLSANTPYAIDETLVDGYTFVSITGDAKCPAALGGTITLDEGDDITCTITNDDQAGSITIIKNSVPNAARDFSFTSSSGDIGNFSLDDDSNPTLSDRRTFGDLSAGSYTVTEAFDNRWNLTNLVCSDPDRGSSVNIDTRTATIDLDLGEDITCTFRNSRRPQLTVKKHVITDDGGNKVASDFTMNVTGVNPSLSSFSGSESGTLVILDPGSFSVDEIEIAGYVKSFSANCSGTLAYGNQKTCTITNDDQAGTLIVKKVVVNDNGGTLEADDFTFKVNDGTATAFESDGQNDLTVNAGSYTVTEPSVSGYSTTYDNCTSVVVANGGTQTCTITNDDVAPKLNLKKIVVNDPYNGSAEDADWVLTATGTQGFSDSGDSQDLHTVKANVSYVLSEDGPEGYTAGAWSCGRANLDGNSLTLGLAQEVTCEITNEANPGTLKVKKIVVNDNGGTKVASDFVFQVNDGEETPFLDDGGDELVSERTLTLLNAGEYTVTEPEVAGYETTYENCSKVDLTNGEIETCTITNDDTYGRVNVIKFNDRNGDGNQDEGEEVLSGWDITLGDDTVTTDENGEAVFATVLPAHYVLDEVLQPGWKQTGISCDTSEPTVTPTPTPVDEEVTPTPTTVPTGGICHWNEGADKWNALSVNIDNPGHAGHEKDFVYDGPRDVNGHPANDPHNKDNPALNGDAWCEANNPENLTVFDRILNFFGVDDVNAQSDNANTGHPVNVQTGDVINCTIGNKAIPITIELTKTADVTNVSPNSFINYTLEFTNTSEVPVYDVEVKDYTPFEFDYVEGTTKIDGSAASDPSVNGSVLTWSLATVQAGDTITIEYRMQAPSDLAEGKYTNIAVASAYNLDDSSDVTDSGFNIFSLFSVPEVSAATLTPQRVQTYTELATAVVQYARGASFSTGVGGQVLGASTEILPASGSATYILITLLSVLALGVWFKYLARKRLD